MEFRKVNYASVSLDANGHGVLNLKFEEPVHYYGYGFSEDEIQIMDNGSYYILDNGLANSVHIRDGQKGLTYAYVLNAKAGIGDPKFIDVWTPCVDTSGYVGVSIKQITAEFAKHIFKEFNLPFHLEYDHKRSSFEIIPDAIDSLIGRTFIIGGIEVTVDHIFHPTDEEADGYDWWPSCIHGKTPGGQDRYFGYLHIKQEYPGIIGQDPEIRG